MQVTSVRLPTETIQQIEWLKTYLEYIAPMKFTTTDIIKIAINELYKKESNK